MQETYVRALKAMNGLQAESNVKSWLFVILRNVWLNQLRRVHIGPKVIELDADAESGDLAVEPSKDPHALYVSGVELEQVREAILKLPAEFREVIILREYEELSYEQIAELLDCPAGTVMSRLARARAKLRILLCPECEPAGRKRHGSGTEPSPAARARTVPSTEPA